MLVIADWATLLFAIYYVYPEGGLSWRGLVGAGLIALHGTVARWRGQLG